MPARGSVGGWTNRNRAGGLRREKQEENGLGELGELGEEEVERG